MSMLDGNAIAGLLADLFGDDMTTARLRCAGCDTTGSVAGTRVLMTGIGTVARCPKCDTVLLTVVDDGDRRWVGMPGVRVLGLRPQR